MLFHRKMEILHWPRVQQLPLSVTRANVANLNCFSLKLSAYYFPLRRRNWVFPRVPTRLFVSTQISLSLIRSKHSSNSSSFPLKSLTHLPNHHPIQTRTKSLTFMMCWSQKFITVDGLSCSVCKKGELHTGAPSGVRVVKYFASPGVCVCVCVRACVGACARARVCVCVCVCTQQDLFKLQRLHVCCSCQCRD